MSSAGSARGYFSNESIERVRTTVDIVSVVGRYVNLKRSGRNMKGLCPFHREKTPSFFVSQERQMYHCFGCGAGGDAFSFLMNYLGFTFREAVEELATEAGVELETSGRDTSRTDIFMEILAESKRFYRDQIRGSSGVQAREYLKKRNLSEQTIEKLGIGWAPSGNQLSTYLRGKGYSESQLVESGIALRSRNSDGIYDRFRDRILFPISDRRGRIISFGGRYISKPSSDTPKYINGPESPVYRKGDYLYGYREALRAARDLDMIILVEGYFDHSRFMEAGFDCVVATCGTAITSSQARQICAVSSDILICYDGDKAGQRAAVRAAEVILEQGHLPGIISIPDGKDPDDYISENGAGTVPELTAGALDPIRFALGLLGSWSGIKGSAKKVKVVRRLVGIASSTTDPIIMETLLKVISEETGYSVGTLESQVAEEERKRQRYSNRFIQNSEINRWDKAILGSILLDPEGFNSSLLEFLEEGDFRTERGSRIFLEIRKQAGEGVRGFQLSGLDAEDASACSEIMSSFPDQKDQSGRDSIENAVNRYRLEQELDRLKTRLKSAGDSDIDELKQQISEIGKKLIRM
jgi:DNA primase